MPWSTPTLSEIRSLNRDNLSAYLPGADATVPNSVLRVLSDQNAGGAYLNLLYLDWLSRQFLPDTAEAEWLDRQGNIWLGGRKAATFASGAINVTGNQGVLLPSGSTLATSDAIQYQTTQDAYLGVAATAVPAIALTSGAAANRPSGAQLALSVAVAGVNAQATVVTMTGGADPESDDDLRARVLLRIRRPPMGGDADDYVQWTLAVPGVTRAWVSPLEMGIGTVTVRFMCDDLRADAQGFPQPEDVLAARTALDAVRPVAVKDFFVAAPLRYELSLTVRNLSDDTQSMRRQIVASVQAMLDDRAAPGQTIYAAWVSAAISDAVGDGSFDLDFEDAVMPNGGTMAVLTNVFFA